MGTVTCMHLGEQLPNGRFRCLSPHVTAPGGVYLGQCPRCPFYSEVAATTPTRIELPLCEHRGAQLEYCGCASGKNDVFDCDLYDRVTREQCVACGGKS